MPGQRRRIQELVTKLLEANSVTEPPVPVDLIAKARGIQIRHQHYQGQDLSGFLYREADRAIIGVNYYHDRTRQRFTIAHELGHYLLHKASFKEIHIDKPTPRLNLQSQVPAKGTDLEEMEANFFAAELLVPETFIRKDLAQIRTLDIEDEESIKKLARRYGVSPQTLLFRLARLGHSL